MKTLAFGLLLVSSLSAPFAHANPPPRSCPPLAGVYHCKGDVKNFNDRQGPDSRTTIAQAVENGAMKYWLPLTSNPEDPAYFRIADGKAKTFVEHDSHLGDMRVTMKTTCAGNRVIDVMRMTPVSSSSIAGKLMYLSKRTFEFGARGGVRVTDYFEQQFDGQTETRTNVSACRRK